MNETLNLLVSQALYAGSLMQYTNNPEVSGIHRIDRRRTASITIITAPGDPRRIKQKLLPLLQSLELPPGYSIEFDPDKIKEADELSSTIISLIMAVLFCYMIIAAINESFITPLIILSAIPPSLAIPALCLFITGASYNSAVACAFIAASGMTVNAAVICVDALNSPNNSADNSIYGTYRAIRRKIPALIATTTTTIAGAIPFLFLREGANTLIRTLSLVCAVGISCSFFISITLIPSLSTLYKKSSKLFFRNSAADA
jgi:multidrug efflux pump subunit AcrB